jgi:hypothetical protein
LARKAVAADVARVSAMKIAEPPAFSKPPASYVTMLDDYYRMYRQARGQSIFVPLLFCMSDRPRESCRALASSRLH